MKTLAETLEMVLETNKGSLSVNPNGNSLPSRSLPKIEPQAAGRTESDIDQFTQALWQACIALKQYGKSPAELKAMRDMFLAVLSDIPAAALTKALFIHLNTSDEIPTPKQLREILYPPKPEWKPDWPVYIALKKKIHEGYFPLSDEKQFLRDCENYATEKRGNELEQYERVKDEVGAHLQLVQAEGYE